MTIKRKLLTGMFALSLTIPMTFAACPVTSDGCGCNKDSEIVTPSNATCSKCKKSDCGCNKKWWSFKRNSCDPCEKPKSDCGCPTGGAAPCKESKPLNQQSYAYPSAIYSHANTQYVGEEANNAQIGDSLLDSNCCNGILNTYKGVPVECGCPTGGAAPVIDADKMPQYDCLPAPNVTSTTNMDIIKKSIVPHDFVGMTGAAADINHQQYPDVFDSYWASSDINRLTEQCVLEGYPDGMFKPNRKVSRAEMAAMVVKGYNLDVTSNASALTFKDVPKNHWAHDFISKGVAENMIAGKTSDRFAPNENISRTEALTIMAKGINCPMDCAKAEEILSRYKDGSSVPSWAKEHVAKAIDNGALKHERNQDFIRPADKTTRAEASAMLQGMRLAGGYDKSVQTASQDLGGKTFIEKETRVTIPTLQLTMNDIINAKHVNVGEQFSATTTNEITINGKVFPCGSTVRGKVTEVIRPTSKCEGGLRLSFNEIIGCDGCKAALPKQILTAQVERKKEINGVLRLVQMPFTLAGSLIGTAGRTVGGAAVGLSNAAEALLDQTGVGTSELLSGKFKAAGRSYQDGIKTTLRAPVDLTRTALSGTLGLFQTTGDEIAYLVDPSGNPIAKVNPKEKITIAFGK
ncbi:MAG: S-layer homology domain-containing protein [Candidatus Gastranaerophilales bacterium]|nr:S-layer homology domain-containing protein [Candidatus Gastranaerophilales bacterium]